MNFKEFLYEELTNKQKDIVDDWGETKAPIEISKHVIPKGQDRIVVPLSDPHDAMADPRIESHLKQHGYEVADYKRGKAKDKYGREVNIAKVLDKTQAAPVLKHHFLTDPNRSHKLHDNLQVVISRHPYDVAGMSTNQHWTSCLDMSTGIEAGRLPNEVHSGTHVAYLTHKGDDTAKEPLARIALKPFKEEKSDRTVLIPERKLYGAATSSFEHTVFNWANDHFPLKDNTFYTKHPRVYDDDKHDIAAKIDTITPEKIQHLKSASSHVNESNSKLRKSLHVARYGDDEQKRLLHDHPNSIVSNLAKNLL